jgi:hypothetical protein
MKSSGKLAAFSLPLIFLAVQVAAEIPVWDEAAVKEYCKSEWADDFSMQAYCVNKNKEGFESYLEMKTKNAVTELESSFSACETEWQIQWDMVEYCSSKQVDGYNNISAILSSLPSDAAKIVSDKCSREWGTDFSMVEYCLEKDASAWRELNN